MSGFTVRLPTQEEIDDHEQLNTTWVHMTNDAPWKPYSSEFATMRTALGLQWMGALNFTALSPEI